MIKEEFSEIKFVNSLPEDLWRRFIIGHPASNVFHTPEMFRVFDYSKGYINRTLGRWLIAMVKCSPYLWHIFKWGAENGFQVYDFGGAGTPDEEYGVRNFKAKFGGELVNYGRNTYIHKPSMFRLSKLGYWLYKKIL